MLDSRGPGQDCLPWTMETWPSLVSHFPPSKQPFLSSYIQSCPDSGVWKRVKKEHFYFKDPFVGPLKIQVSSIWYHLSLDTVDKTKVTLNPYHSSHSAAILTSKNPIWLQKFVGFQHNSQSKHLRVFKSSSITSISLHRKQEWGMEAQFKEKEHTGEKG